MNSYITSIKFFIFKNYTVIPATLDQQVNESWDFHVVGKKNLFIEVKTDYAAAKTGNIFLETEVDNKPGFLRKILTESKIIFAFVFPQDKEINFVDAVRLLDVDTEKLQFRRFKHKSNNYLAGGYLLPKEDFYSLVFKRYCWGVVENNKKVFHKCS